jgi:flagellar biosynthesis protein FlhB
MAEEYDDDDKPKQPASKQLQATRKKGNVTKSRDP